MSTHEVKAYVTTEVRAHPNADRLDIIPVPGTVFQSCVHAGSLKVGDPFVFIEPDYVVDTSRPEFAFLAGQSKPGKHRLRAVKLRGAVSHGLIIAYTPEIARAMEDGQSIMDFLDVVRYEPPLRRSNMSAQSPHVAPAPNLPGLGKFDLEAYRPGEFDFGPAERVYVTEKIHGMNARYVMLDGKLHGGSRNLWWKEGSPTPIWEVDNLASIRNYCEDHPGVVLFGEVFGAVQDYRYGRDNKVSFAPFAMYRVGEGFGDFLAHTTKLQSYWLAPAPVLYCGKFDLAVVKALAEGDSTVPGAPMGHPREGVVITSELETRTVMGVRRSYKLISNRYWTDKKG